MAEQNGNFMSKSAFAKLQDWSRSYVSKLSAQGKLVRCPDNSKLIDVSATLKALGRSAPGGEKPATAQTEPGATSSDPNYWASKARHEAAMAKLSEMELARRSGELVDRRRVEMAAFTIARTLRDGILGVPVRMGLDLEKEKQLYDELRGVLDGMAKYSAADLERAMAPDD